MHKKQKAVSRWYDQNPSSSALDVYEPEWSDRLLQWYIASTLEHLIKVSDIASYGTLNNLDWVGLASENPVAAVALWKLLQASYQLDDVICIRSQEFIPAVQRWQKLKPFEYLSSSEVRARWTESLENLRTQFEAFEDEDAIVHRMCEMRCAVDALENAWKELEASWAVNLAGYSSKDLMLTRIREAITWRFSTLNSAMKDDSTNVEEQDISVKSAKDKKKRRLRNLDTGDKKRQRLCHLSTA